MFVFSADFFLTIPGLLLLLAVGLPPLCLLSLGPVTVGGVTFSVNSMLLCLLASILGLQLCLTGAIAESLYDGTGPKRERWLKLFPYTRTTVTMAVTFVVGLVLVIRFVAAFISKDYEFTDALAGLNHGAIFGLFLVTGSALVFVFMLLIHAIGLYLPVQPRPAETPT